MRLPSSLSLSIVLAAVPACLATHVPDEALPSGPEPGDGTGQDDTVADDGEPTGDDTPAADPLPEVPWEPVMGNPAQLNDGCGNVTLTYISRHDQRILVGVATGQLFETTDGMKTWTELGTEPDSDPFENLPFSVTEDPDDPDQYWVTGIYGPFGLFHTVDRGKTFHIVGPDTYDPEEPERVIIKHNDAVAIDFEDKDRSTMLLSGHEAVQTLWRSQDAGETWENIGLNLPEESGISNGVRLIDADTFLVGVRTWTSPGGVFKSFDAGETWEKVYPHGTAGSPSATEDGVLYWGLESKLGVIRSEDDGDTWERVLEYQEDTPVALLPGDLLAVLTSAVEISEDGGDSWSAVTSRLPYQPNNLYYHEKTKRLIITRAFCEPDNPEEAIMTYKFSP